MNHFFVAPSQINGEKITITGADVKHIKQVLRMKPGEELSVSNQTDHRKYRCEIDEIQEDSIICTLRFVIEEGAELPSCIYLFQGLPKGDKMELIIQKAVELGVYKVIPVTASRCVVKLDDKKARTKVSRWQGIAESAAKQCKRSIVPEVSAVMTMQEAIAYAAAMDVRLIPYELAEGMDKTKQIIGHLKGKESVAVFIGPEGGFAEREIALAKEANIIPITLGKRILRTETAGLAILAWIMYQLEG